MELSTIINLSITRTTRAVTRAGFGTLLLIGTHKVFNERIREYTTAAALLTDGFESTDEEYLAALAFFSQNPNQNKIKIGRRQVDKAVITVSDPQNTTLYTTTINGTVFSFTSDGTATAEEIAAGLKIDIDGGSEPVTVTDNLDGTYDVDPTVAGTAFSITTDSRQTITKPYTASETQLVAYAAIKDIDPDFYGIASTDKIQTDVEAFAALILTENRIYGTSSSDANLLDGVDTTNIASVLKAANNERTFVMYHASPSTYPEVAWLSRQLSTVPGSSTWKFKTLLGITSSILTPTQSTNALNKNANTYETVGGVSITAEGKMCGPTPDGEFIDIIRGVDWLHARITERIFSRLVNLEKISFTDGGASIIEGEIRAQINEGIANGLIAQTPEPIIFVPLIADVSSADKIARTFPDVTFEATLAGAIHFTTITGNVLV